MTGQERTMDERCRLCGCPERVHDPTDAGPVVPACYGAQAGFPCRGNKYHVFEGGAAGRAAALAERDYEAEASRLRVLLQESERGWAAALADHEAEAARLRADLDAAQRNQDMLAAVVDYGGQLDQLTDENDRLREAIRWLTDGHCEEGVVHHLLPYEGHLYCRVGSDRPHATIDLDLPQPARAALSGGTLRSSGEEEANGG